MDNLALWLPEDYNDIDSRNFRRPFHTFLIKISSLCNLNCSYCYVYQSPDKSWKWKPKTLELEIASQIASRIQEHVNEYSLNEITIIFHGGEPLLLGLIKLQNLVNVFSTAINCPIHFSMQTNGTLLDKSIVDFFFDNNFQIGLSLDGNRMHNDKHRVYHNGKSTYLDTINAISLIKSYKEWRKLLGGLLIVIDINNKPFEILEELRKLDICSANLLLPDGHYEALPPDFKLSDNIVYGRWLTDFFELWYNNYSDIEIPYFEEIISLMLGGISGAEEIGAKSVDLIVIDTNGDIEAVDTLKIVGREATSLNMNVSTHSFNDALGHPAIYSRMSGYNSLCQKCRKCEYLDNCGGGYIPHRYSTQNGFINPSIYCEDLKYLFSKIRKYVFQSNTNDIYTN